MKLNKKDYKQIHSTIMIVDDEPIILETVQAHLEDCNYSSFVLVEDPSLALQKIEETNPDILLLDIAMPEVSGFDILSELRAHPEFKHLPIIILTASSDNENKIKALGLGATDFLTKPVDPAELCLRVYNTLASKTYQDELAFYDPLTGLPNRQMFLKCFDGLLDKAKKNGSQLAVMNVELDKFDTINDTVGIKLGDEMLRMAAMRLAKIAQNGVDLLDLDVEDEFSIDLFRIDGGSFALLAEPLQSPETATALASLIVESIKKPVQINTLEMTFTVSIGIAIYPSSSTERLMLWRHASSAKNYVKKTNGDHFRLFSSEINALYVKSFDLAAKLRKAVDSNELDLYYQPIVDCRTNKPMGVEALLRWQSDDKLLLPGEFIPLAEDTGIIIQICAWAFERACTDLLDWRRAGIELNNVSIKLDIPANQFAEQTFLSHILKIIKKTGIDPGFLTFEVSERLLHEDLENKIKLLNDLKKMDLKLSIDNFGTGYSSLGILSGLPLDELKIDQSFIENLVISNYNRAVVASIVFLAQSRGLKTIAVGVETADQLEFLQRLDCDCYQGFLFQEPVPGDKIGELF